MTSDIATYSLIDWVKLIGGIVAIIVALFVSIGPKLLILISDRRTRKSLQNGLSSDLYSDDIIERSTRYYVEPDCQSVDPAGSEEPRLTMATKQKLFEFMDDTLNDRTQYKYVILLADTGMGKSSFLLNYYARHLKRSRRKFEVALFPLGIPDVEERISKVDQSANTVLFLDALDEDTQAIVDHAERLKDIIEVTKNFKKIVITCRTQFFPKEEEIPKETGVVKVGPRGAGEKAEHLFHKLYLSPFTDVQVEVYLKRRYSFFRRKQRNKTRKMVQKIPNLIVRPMLLSYINDLVLGPDEEIHYSFELYEKMVEAWLDREEGMFKEIKKGPLREFSEKLAVDIFLNREKRGAERIRQEEVVELAKDWNIRLYDWQLTGRSLLNRDADGNYKFAHRSIMEYLFVKKFMGGEHSCLGIEWTDQMITFAREMIIGESLRSFPVNNLEGLSLEKMIKKFDYFDRNKNKNGKGIGNNFKKYGQEIIFDYSTGLMWQQSGSDKYMNYDSARAFITQINEEKSEGYNDWRLPTLEEAMSLMEPETNSDKLYIDSIFDSKQRWIWTSDQQSASRAWVVLFDNGGCYNSDIGVSNVCVRAVR